MFDRLRIKVAQRIAPPGFSVAANRIMLSHTPSASARRKADLDAQRQRWIKEWKARL